jgi:hypothetical protein
MKLFLNNKTPVLTEEDEPSWSCPDICCFKDLYMGHLSQFCNYFSEIRCTQGYSYTLQNKVNDIFNL